MVAVYLFVEPYCVLITFHIFPNHDAAVFKPMPNSFLPDCDSFLESRRMASLNLSSSIPYALSMIVSVLASASYLTLTISFSNSGNADNSSEWEI